MTAARASLSPAATLAAVQAPVAAHLADVRATMERAVTRDVPLLATAARHLLAMKGKMFRPTLLLLAASVERDVAPSAVPMAAAVELVHLATLVHDDAVDHSALRRGLPTINSLFNDQISVIMGDFLFSTALGLLGTVDDLRPIRSIIDASTRMTVGELRQLSSHDAMATTEEDYEALIRAKTASLIASACEIGSLSGAERWRDALVEYGDALGMLFQITDDIIDYTESSATTGKPAGLDLREHKMTLPVIAALRSMSASERERVRALFDTEEPTDEDVGIVHDLVIERGGLEYARATGERCAERARAALAPLPETPAREALGAAIFYVMERHA